jgi:hypothetical protein
VPSSPAAAHTELTPGLVLKSIQGVDVAPLGWRQTLGMLSDAGRPLALEFMTLVRVSQQQAETSSAEVAQAEGRKGAGKGEGEGKDAGKGQGKIEGKETGKGKSTSAVKGEGKSTSAVKEKGKALPPPPGVSGTLVAHRLCFDEDGPPSCDAPLHSAAQPANTGPSFFGTEKLERSAASAQAAVGRTDAAEGRPAEVEAELSAVRDAQRETEASSGEVRLAALTMADGMSTIMHALATTLGIGGKWKPQEFLERVAAHLGRHAPPGKVRAAHRV